LGSFTWDLRRFSFSAQLFEIDDVIDHAETRRLIADALAAATKPGHHRHGRFADTW
jgi:acetyl-CoA carboxylase carboxyltransferase component